MKKLKFVISILWFVSAALNLTLFVQRKRPLHAILAALDVMCSVIYGFLYQSEQAGKE